MHAILCSAQGVFIGKQKLDIFYYYLVFNATERTPLLGNDFISNCLFVHDIKGDIIIKDFRTDCYKESFQDTAINNVDLLNLLQTDVYTPR